MLIEPISEGEDIISLSQRGNSAWYVHESICLPIFFKTWLPDSDVVFLRCSVWVVAVADYRDSRTAQLCHNPTCVAHVFFVFFVFFWWGLTQGNRKEFRAVKSRIEFFKLICEVNGDLLNLPTGGFVNCWVEAVKQCVCNGGEVFSCHNVFFVFFVF